MFWVIGLMDSSLHLSSKINKNPLEKGEISSWWRPPVLRRSRICIWFPGIHHFDVGSIHLQGSICIYDEAGVLSCLYSQLMSRCVLGRKKNKEIPTMVVMKAAATRNLFNLFSLHTPELTGNGQEKGESLCLNISKTTMG